MLPLINQLIQNEEGLIRQIERFTTQIGAIQCLRPFWSVN